MVRAALIVAIIVSVCLQGCIIIYYPFVRNFTSDSVVLVIEHKRPGESFFWLASGSDKRTHDRGTEEYYERQVNRLLKDNEFLHEYLKDTVRYQGDSSRIMLVLPPHSTTMVTKVGRIYDTTLYHVYIASPGGARRYFGTDINLKAYSPNGRKRTKNVPGWHGDRLVFDIH